MMPAVFERRGFRIGAVAALLVLAVMFPLFFQPLSGVTDDATTALAYVVMALGLNVVVGYAGLLDLGYVAFFALGAYCTGWLASGFHAHVNDGAGLALGVDGMVATLPGIHVNFLLVVLVAAAVTALAGAIIGLPTLRLRGDYVAIVTLAFGEIISRLAINGSDIRIGGFQLTNGRQGITPVDQIELPFFGAFDNVLSLRPYYWLALALVVVAVYVNLKLRGSRLGRAWVAIREDEDVAESMGIPLVRTKLAAYACGAAFGGVAGAFLGSYLSAVNADQFQISFSILIFAMLVLGGLGSVSGAVLGALILSLINTRVIPDVVNDLPARFGLDFDVSEISFGIFGFLLLAMMLMRPAGLLPERRHRVALERARHAAPDEQPGVRP
jgi:branched-chain amino acid transport system permease protein